MIVKLLQCAAALMLIAGRAVAACEGPDEGDATTVVTVPANVSVDVFHYRAAQRASVVEFCVRETGAQWILAAAHGTDQGQWSLLQSWVHPKAVEIKTTAVADGALSPFMTQTRSKTTYGYLFSWPDIGPGGPGDQIVYCFKGGAGCPASRRVDFSE